MDVGRICNCLEQTITGMEGKAVWYTARGGTSQSHDQLHDIVVNKIIGVNDPSMLALLPHPQLHALGCPMSPFTSYLTAKGVSLPYPGSYLHTLNGWVCRHSWLAQDAVQHTCCLSSMDAGSFARHAYWAQLPDSMGSPLLLARRI